MKFEDIAWQPYNGRPAAAFADIDTSACKFKDTPRYFVSLRGPSGGHWEYDGADAIYTPEKDKFRVYVHNWLNTDGYGILNKNKIYVEWIGILESK